MDRLENESKNGPRAIIAWLALIAVVGWLFINWPRAEQEVKTVSGTVETTETGAEKTSNPPAVETQKRVEVTAEVLNFRSHPSPEDKTIIKSVPRGTNMRLISRDKGWANVQLDTGETGYVVDDPAYIKVVE